MIKECGLPKAQRLSSRDDINNLFKEGKGFFSFPFKCIYIISEDDGTRANSGLSVRMMVSVGKKYSKRAVKRNRIKRLTREGFRLNKKNNLSLIESKLFGKVIDICYIYTSPKEENFKTVENGIKKSFEKLASIL